MNVTKISVICCLVMFLNISGSLASQEIVPQSDSPCSGATAKICPILNWPQFHFDSAHTGFNPLETILSPATVGNLVLDWKYQAPPYYEYMDSSPAVFGGALYFAGDGFGNVYDVDARTGGTRWIWENNGSQIGSPAVAYGKVYVADPDRQTIQVLDAGNGHRLGHWGVDIPGDVTVANGTLYAASAHMGYVHYGNVFALDANTGQTLWTRFMQSGRAISPAVANGRVYVECTPDAETPEKLCSMDAATGDTLWQFSPDAFSFFQAAVSNGVVYAGASINDQSDLYALDAVTGAVIWQNQLSLVSQFPRLTTPAIANGIVYIGAADYNDDSYGYLYGIDAHTGVLLWTFNTAGGIRSSAAVANGVVYFGSDDMNIYALDANTGSLLWKYTTGGKVISSPAVVNGMVYVGSNDMYMYAFHLPESVRR